MKTCLSVFESDVFFSFIIYLKEFFRFITLEEMSSFKRGKAI